MRLGITTLEFALGREGHFGTRVLASIHPGLQTAAPSEAAGGLRLAFGSCERWLGSEGTLVG